MKFRFPLRTRSRMSIQPVPAAVFAVSLATFSCGDDATSAPPPKTGAVSPAAQPATQQAAPRLETLVEGRDVVWSLDFLPNGRIIFTERSGALSLFDPTSKSVTAVSGAPTVAQQGQGGLLDVRLHPEFSKNNWVYLSYAVKTPEGATTALARGELKGNALTNVSEIFRANKSTRTGEHFGSRIAFGSDGMVFLSIGDRNARENAQDLSNHLGSILRLTPDGKPAPGNPFIGRPGAAPEVWSYGHRNPQGLHVSAAGEVFSNEHGPRGGDELNRIEKGKNYGWPVITYGREYSGPKIGEGTKKEGLEQPLKYWVPSISPSGLLVYTGDKFPQWKGAFVMGALSGQHLNVVTAQGREMRFFEGRERVREVRQGPDGFIYLGTDSGKILRVMPSTAS